jgi:hypothetical protein
VVGGVAAEIVASGQTVDPGDEEAGSDAH